MPNPSVSLEDLAAQADQLPDDQTFEQEMAHRDQQAPPPIVQNNAPRSRTRNTGPRVNGNGQQVGGLTGLPIGPSAGEGAAPMAERAPSGVIVLDTSTDYDLTDSAGNEYQITVPAGHRVNVSHDHNGDARRPSCAICLGMFEHEKMLRRSAREASNTNAPTRTTLQEETTYDMGVDSQGDEWSTTIPAGASLVVREGHEHSAKRVPTCALCMAIYNHEREIRPAPASKQPKDCECGCGGQTGGRFVPGHDARLYGRVNRYNAWAEENAEKIASGEVAPTAWPQYDTLPEKIRTDGVLKTGHGDVPLAHHPMPLPERR